MPKRPLTAVESFDLRQALQVATLDALMASRRWEPGDLIFQGGTSLHLAYGSPRFSEDLDFLVSDALKLDSIAESVQTRLEGASWFPADTRLTVTKARESGNLHAFDVTLGGQDVLGAVRVKVEMWRADKAAMAEVAVLVRPVRLNRGPTSGMQTFVPTAELQEILADKVFALGARPYLKPRDVFDLYWLQRQNDLRSCSEQDMKVRLAFYRGEDAFGWIEKAQQRVNELSEPTETVVNDLRRWLPSSWPLTAASAEAMKRAAVDLLERGIERMREVEATRDAAAALTP